MLPYESFFYGGMFFLAGVIAASMGIAPFFITASALMLGALFLVFHRIDHKKRNVWFAGLFVFLVVGSVWYRIDDAHFRADPIPFGAHIEVFGVVKSDPIVKGDTQEMTIAVSKPFNARIFTKLSAHPKLAYGDVVSGRATIERPTSDGYARYLEGQYIRGVMNFPNLEKTGEGNGSRVKSFLLGIKHAIVESFARVLSPEEATFLSGLTIGARGEFSKELSDAMQRSGTTHLVALSGYNISILVYVVMGILLHMMPRRIALIFATYAITGFVIMTGAESSVVRAAIIGFIILASFEIGRVRDFRNIIVFACILMVMLSPKILMFDIGFQLSFLSLLGIVYLSPILARTLGMEENDVGFLSWKTAFIATLSAQLATLPILVGSFGSFSPIALLSNSIVLEFIPLTMTIGFLIALIAPFSHYIALVFGLAASVFLKFELFIIYFFARLSIPVHFSMGVFWSVAYYALLLWWIYAYKKIPHDMREENIISNVRDA